MTGEDWGKKNPVICLLTFKAFLLYPCWLFPCPFQHPAACSFLRSIIGGAISAHRFHRDWVMDHFVIWWMLKCTSPNFSWAFCYWELGLCQGVLLKVSEWPRKQFITFETTGFLYINSSQICVYFNHIFKKNCSSWGVEHSVSPSPICLQTNRVLTVRRDYNGVHLACYHLSCTTYHICKYTATFFAFFNVFVWFEESINHQQIKSSRGLTSCQTLCSVTEEIGNQFTSM